MPFFLGIVFLAAFFWAQQQECIEYPVEFTEDFGSPISFKDEEKSSVAHWGEGYITLNFAGILHKVPLSANIEAWINMVGYADFDFDGFIDFVATSDEYYRKITFIKNIGDGTFEEKSPDIWFEPTSPYKVNSLLAGDFDGDGDPDFMYVLSTKDASTSPGPLEEVWFFEHEGYLDANGVPQFTRWNYNQLRSDLEGIGWGVTHQTIDIDGDGDLDILFANGYGKVLLLRNDGTKPLSDTSKFSVSTLIDAKVGETGYRWNKRGVIAIGVGDFDKDGDSDIIIGAINWRKLKYYKNDGTGNFTLHTELGDMESPYDLNDNLYDGACTTIAVADYDKDGDLDFMVGTDNWNRQEAYPPVYENTGMGAKVFYFKNDGTGDFTSTLIFNRNGPWDFDFGLPLDFDNDGDIDFMVADGNHSEFYYIFENILSDRFNLSGEAVSTNVTKDSFPDGLDQTQYAITKVQFTNLTQGMIGSHNGLKVTYYVSNNGGRDWELYAEFYENQIHTYNNLPVHTFSTFGTDLRWKAVMEAPDDYPDPNDEYHGTSNDTPKIEKIDIKYYYVDRREYSRSSVVATRAEIDGKDKKLIIAGTFIYPGWEGHLRAYDVTNMGMENTSNTILKTVSRYDATSPSGREIIAPGVDILWDAGEILNSRSASDRKVYTAVEQGGSLVRHDFSVAELDTLGPILQDVNNDNEGLINFVRGEGRDWKLGDINHSNPIVVGPPDGTSGLMGNGYDQFLNDNKDRRKVLYVGANDGMIHCFDICTGEELWAFIPYNLLPKLKNMWAFDPATGERYFIRDIYVDGTPKAADVYINGGWKTILICGQGPGKGSIIGGGINYYFALDITDPYNPKPLWEFTHERLGETWSVPAIGKVVKGGVDTWVAFVGSGYDNNPDQRTGNRFYAVDLETGKGFWNFNAGEVDTTKTHGWNIKNTIPCSPSIVDKDNNGKLDCVYVGDLDGRIWKVDVSNNFTNINSWREKVIYEDSNNYPIISNPVVWVNAKVEIPLPRLYFGTGGDDKAPNDALYSFIALIDDKKPEVEWFIGDPSVLKLPSAKDAGDLGVGEKVWADPKINDFIVYFSTLTGNIESVDPCESLAGIGSLYARFVIAKAGSTIGSTAFRTASGPVEALSLEIKTRSAVTIGESEKVQGQTRKREVYIQEYDSTIQKLEQAIGALLRVKSWREVYRIIR